MATGQQGPSNMLSQASACLGGRAGFETGLDLIDAETDFCSGAMKNRCVVLDGTRNSFQ